MPAYNADKFLEKTIESVIDQTYKNWELIIIDDGSTDKTSSLAQKFCGRDNRIKYFYQIKGNQGNARNLGISFSEGNYIAFLDADDLWTKDKLAQQISYLTSHPKIDLIFSQGFFLDGKKTFKYNTEIKTIWELKHLDNFINENKIPISSVVVKKKAIEKVGGFPTSLNTQFGEDYLLWLKLLASGFSFASIEQRLFYYRLHPNQVTKFSSEDNLKLLDLYMDFYVFYNDKNAHKAIIKKVRWGVFESQNSRKYFDFCHQAANNYNRFLGVLISLSHWIPSKSLRKKIAFKLFVI